MNRENIDEVKRLLIPIKRKAREDTSLSDEQFDELSKTIHFLEKVLDDYADMPEEDIGKIRTKSDKSTKLFAVLDRIAKERNPSYVDEFIRAVADSPFTLPSTLFQPEGAIVVFVDVHGLKGPRLQTERGENALDMLFPGSISHRYFGIPVKIDTGEWYRDFKCRLKRFHELSEDPIFQVAKDGRTLDVYQPLTLRARVIPFDYRVCAACLSLARTDEQCDHFRAWRVMKLPSAAPIKIRKEITRKTGDTATLRPPLNSMVEEVTLLKSLEVGVAAIGFERQRGPVTVVVDYDPPVGLKLNTRGIAFKLKISDGFLDQLLSKKYIARDLAIQIIANRLREAMREMGIPSYNFQPLMSAMIMALSLDTEVDVKRLEDIIRQEGWVEDAIESVKLESNFIERFEVGRERMEAIFHSMRDTQISEVLRDIARDRLTHTLAHAILIAGCITSGSTFDDLDYLVKKDEIVLFDSVNGGNGSSEMIYEFLTSKEEFSIGAFVEELTKGRTYKPKHFDEALMELLLPCNQGVAERIFHKNLPVPTYTEILRRIEELRENETPSSVDVTEFFPSAIGYHRVADSRDIRTAERRRGVFEICIHGCPDCVSLGNKCNTGSFIEKYNISKTILDEFFKYATVEITLGIDSGRGKIEEKLKEKKAVIIKQQVTSEDEQERVRTLALELDGTEFDGKYASFAGFWIDCAPDSTSVDYSVMMVLV